MRTKTLVLAAALSAAGIANLMAQSNVYSVNVVGYVNSKFGPGTAAPSLAIAANPLNAATNTLAALIQNPSANTIVSFFNPPASFDAFSWNGSQWNNGVTNNRALAPGEGVFVSVAANNPGFTNTWVGEVLQGALSIPLLASYQLVGSQVPQQGLVQTDLNYPAVPGDVLLRWITASGGFESYSRVADGTGISGGNWGFPGEPTINVAEGFFSRKAVATTWTRNFTVQ